MNQTFNSISSEELCKKLSIKDTRSLITTNGFPKPLFNEGEMLFSKEEVLKYFNIQNIDEPFITCTEAAKYLGMSSAHLKNLSQKNEVPFYRLKSVKGSGYLFRKSELEILRKINIEGDSDFVNYFVGNEIMKNIFLNYIKLYKNEVTSREYDIIYEYFFNRKTFAEIGIDFELTTLRVNKIFNKAIRRFKRLLSTENMLNIGELKREIHKKDMLINDLMNVVNNGSNLSKKDLFDEHEKLNYCVSFLSTELDYLDFSVRALNVLHQIDIYSAYDLLNNYNTYDTPRKNVKKLLKLRNLGKRTYNEIVDSIENIEIKMAQKTGIDIDEFLTNNPKTPNNLILFSKIHSHFKA